MNNYIVFLSLLFFLNSDLFAERIESIKEIQLYESPELPISSVANVSVNSKGTLIILSDPKSGVAHVFSLTSGRLIKSIFAGRSFSDSLLSKGRWPVNGYKYADIRDSNIEKWRSKNIVKNAIFISDSIILANGILYTTIAKIDSIVGEDEYLSNASIAGHSSTFLFNLNNQNSVSPYEWRHAQYSPQSECITYNPRSRQQITNILNNGVVSRGNYDSSFCIAEYSIDGKFNRYYLQTLPPECKKYSLGYSIMIPKVNVSEVGNLYLGFLSLPRIYDVSNSHYFDLVNLPVNNEDFFVSLNNFFSTYSRGSRIPWDSLYLKRQYLLSNIATNQMGNICVTSILYNLQDHMGPTYVVQEYTVNGKYIKEKRISNTNSINYKYVCYSKELNKIVGISLNNINGYYCNLIDF